VGTTAEAALLQRTPIVATRNTGRDIEATAVSVAGADPPDPRKVDTEMRKIANTALETVTKRGRKDTGAVPRTLEDDGNGIPI
jgi:hypothetical protein